MILGLVAPWRYWRPLKEGALKLTLLAFFELALPVPP
jgi:hypothetical protein